MNKVFIRFLFCILWIILFYAIAWPEEEKVLYEGDSLYHHIRVSEEGGYRYLSFNRARGSQSKVCVAEPFKLQFPYTRAAFVVPAFLEKKPERILLIGMGGGSIPRVMAKNYPGADIDIVEIDEDVITAAKKYFFFIPTSKMKITVMDGRRFLRSSTERYDIIFLDAYDDMSIPFHLTTKEFFALVKQRLSPDGIVASNIWGPNTDEFYLSEVRTYQEVFSHVYMIDAVPSNNYILIACSLNKVMTKTILEERATSLQKQYEFDFPLMTYAETFEDLSAVSFNARVLLDDYAPVEVLRSKKASK
jgi:spermidine synthase